MEQDRKKELIARIKTHQKLLINESNTLLLIVQFWEDIKLKILDNKRLLGSEQKKLKQIINVDYTRGIKW